MEEVYNEEVSCFVVETVKKNKKFQSSTFSCSRWTQNSIKFTANDLDCVERRQLQSGNHARHFPRKISQISAVSGAFKMTAAVRSEVLSELIFP